MQKNSLDTIKNVANVCCVQFSAHSSHLLAFGSADYRTYCYDLRFTKIPWCVLAGHEKAVSFVKFLDSETLVSASTDNTLKVWDLNKTSPSGLSNNACSLTLSGHANEKVGFLMLESIYLSFLILTSSSYLGLIKNLIFSSFSWLVKLCTSCFLRILWAYPLLMVM